MVGVVTIIYEIKGKQFQKNKHKFMQKVAKKNNLLISFEFSFILNRGLQD